MATDLLPSSAMPNRRHCLQTLGAGALTLLAPWARANRTPAPPTRPVLLAAWQADQDHRVGLVQAVDQGWAVQRQLTLPGRPHGLHAFPDDSVLVAARRPGDWLLHWHPEQGHTAWHWEHSELRFNGHVLHAPHDPKLFFSSETDQDSGTGRIGLWQRQGLQRLASWSSHGLDPHQLLLLPEPVAQLPAGTLLVANGGIPTQAESGRSKKQLDRMDPSLVALDPHSGALLGQWRLPDPRLSIRHLAWNPVSRQLGIALQAEHDDPVQRQAAPVLARWDGHTLQTPAAPPDLRGYGGSVCATPDGGFCVSCPRAGGVAWFDAQGQLLQLQALPQACPLAWQGDANGQLWAGGGASMAHTPSPSRPELLAAPEGASRWLFDNHWLLMPSPQPSA